MRHPQRREHRRGAPGSKPPLHRRRIGTEVAHPATRFLVKFAVLALAAYGVLSTPGIRDHWFPGYLRANARAAAIVTTLLGERAAVKDRTVGAGGFSLEVREGCDAIEPSAIFALAVLVSPVPWRRKCIGIVLGVALLAVLNLARIVSLVFVGIHAPRVFEFMHVEVWQAVFAVLAVLLWRMWGIWAGAPHTARGAPS